MKTYSFFALLSRMRLIRRWSLMQNRREENVAEHCYEVAVLAHLLAWIRKLRYSDRYACCPDPKQVLALALFHDAPEILTGDLPTPVKYYDSQMRAAFARLEQQAVSHLLSRLPEDLQAVYTPLLSPDTQDQEVQEALRLVKAADKLSAWLKCEEEVRQGNPEFSEARVGLYRMLEELELVEVKDFLRSFAPDYGLSLDALKTCGTHGEELEHV